MCLLTKLETEVAVSYNNRCRGKGSKDKLEYPDMVMRLLCDQACWDADASTSIFSQIQTSWVVSSLRKTCPMHVYTPHSVYPGPHVQYLLKNYQIKTLKHDSSSG